MNCSVIPYLWFDSHAQEAAEFYTSLFLDSRITLQKPEYTSFVSSHSNICDSRVVEFELVGKRFFALNGGNSVQFNPAISLTVTCKYLDLIDELWGKLSKGGTVIMEYANYPFARRFGWVKDRYGMSWQVVYAENEEIVQKVTPTLLFVGNQAGKAREALTLYSSIFNHSEIEALEEYGDNNEPNPPHYIEYARTRLNDYRMIFMDSALPHTFEFNKSISFVIMCNTQDEIDFYWSKLSAYPEAEKCGWIKDRFGISWQIVPASLNAMVTDKDQNKAHRVIDALVGMKKIIISDLENAYQGNSIKTIFGE